MDKQTFLRKWDVTGQEADDIAKILQAVRAYSFKRAEAAARRELGDKVVNDFKGCAQP